MGKDRRHKRNTCSCSMLGLSIDLVASLHEALSQMKEMQCRRKGQSKRRSISKRTEDAGELQLTDKAQHNRNKVFLWQSNSCVLTLARVPLKLNDTPVTKNSFTTLLRAVLCFEEGDSACVELKQHIASRRMGCRKVVRLLPSQIVAD